ncbi:HAMP domain-containing protein [Clostridium fermenticellae]|uniref:histidine kinase n=1 Tax=Clostridium fermenticellae TaxID=2068654 RepID=A0A386H4T4_9CLOT|nr:HAMP domain-containing sensor histidine kinase [Clostridium fermenticellae]AYD40515.1 HAMP domain-containing protein [Clostridium fermenticellae]
MNIISKIKKSVTRQLFTITFLVFIIFITCTTAIQSIFFGRFYIDKKKSDLEQTMIKFKTNYDKTDDPDKIKEIMSSIEDSHNVKLAILDKYGKLKFIVSYDNEKLDESRIRAINSAIKSSNIDPTMTSKTINNGKPLVFISDKPKDPIKDIISVDFDKKKGEILFAISSLQPVNEASSVIKEFYIYFLIIAIFVILILSLFYSHAITKPLVILNKSALKMADLDFSQKSNIKRDDEIGSLSNTLNFLSENLFKSLNSLRSANLKLEKDIEKERELEKMRKEFVAAASHELKTPISLIEGYAEAIKDGVFSDSKEHDYYLDVIIDESKIMGNLVYDMLQISQLESGRLILNKENFYLDKMLDDIISKFSTLINQKNIELHAKIDKSVKINADWNKIEQVINNFLTNAIRYTNKNEIINIYLKYDNPYFTFSIENSSNPMSDEQLSKIWDRFYKVDKSGNRKLGGTGLGLTIVKNILILHKFDFGVRNTALGIEFYFSNAPSNSDIL